MIKKKIHLVVGGRPNYIKSFNLIRVLKKKKFKIILILTNQHYDHELNQIFFDELKINRPDIVLKNKGSNVENIKQKYQKVLDYNRPELVVVFGDMNSALGAALAAKNKRVPIAHVESGLRSFDKRMPEEKNRIAIDKISSLLFCTTQSALKNLNKENVKGERFFVGNSMIDTLKILKSKIINRKFYKKLNLIKKKYVVLTLHRNFNVDTFKKLKLIINEINELSTRFNLVFSVHPRTKKNLIKYSLLKKLNKKVLIKSSFSYINFLSLVKDSQFVITDSGGIQEETSSLKINCFTLRNNTERPITVNRGTNYIVREKNFSSFIFNTMSKMKKGKKIKYWDGGTSIRISKIISQYFKKLHVEKN